MTVTDEPPPRGSLHVRDVAAYILERPALIERLPLLGGKVLGCWCYPQLCHGAVLIELLRTKPRAMENG